MTSQELQRVAAPGEATGDPAATGVADWGGGQEAGVPAASGPKIGRYIAALRRFKWLIAAFVLIGAGAGYGATRFLTPEYEVQARLILEMQTGTQGAGRGPIQAPELLSTAGWKELLRSYAVLDQIVSDLSLFVTPRRAADSTLFREFRVNELRRLIPGTYVLTVNGTAYTLAMKSGMQVERGATGDSIGRDRGFLWQPPRTQLTGKREVEFTVQTPREASRSLNGRLGDNNTPGSPYLFLSFRDTDPQRAAVTLNKWVEEFISVATAFKKKTVAQYAAILEGQRDFAAGELANAEASLSGFRTTIITLPSDRQTFAPGIDMTTNPALEGYLGQKIVAENLQRDRERLEQIYENGKDAGTITREAVLSIPSVNTDPAAENLRRVMAELSDREFSLRKAREGYTDSMPQVKAEIVAYNTVRMTTVPNAVFAYVQQLRIRERQLAGVIDLRTKDLRGIPARTIEEGRLKRQLDLATEMFRNLDTKTQEAKLAEAATVSDIGVLDSAVAPLGPTRNTAPVLIFGAIAASFGLAIVLAILLDQVDKRFRYPEQATDDLGLFILGVVPNVHKKGRQAADQAAQVVEAFRSIRMNVRYAADPAFPLMMTVTSPGPNDGKSLISSNLALSFAESGARTLVIDGDIRRGDLATTFGAPARPGLVEYLDGTALIAEVLHPTKSHPNLTLIAAGARRRRAPELLATPRLTALLAKMASEFDVVIVDSPPLGAGFDAYALATATRNMMLVMRVGITDRKMAAAKMAVVDTLPVRVMGAVLNGIEMSGVYQYYSYYQDYSSRDEEPEYRALTEGVRVADADSEDE